MTEENQNQTENQETETLTKYSEIKQQYEKQLQEKENQIHELEKQLQQKNQEVDQPIETLNDEVNDKLEQAQKIKDLQATVEELVQERAEATVDAYIQKGIILPSQKEAAKKLCLTDNDTFLDLYRDAKPLIETQQQRKSVPTGTAERIANYFKN